jgi:hypothetical protein
MIISIIVSEILGIVLSLLSSAYFYLTELLLILIILPIILLIVTFSPNMSNKAKIFILIFNIIYSLLLSQIISKLLLVIKLLIIIIFLYYKIILNNMYMLSYFSIFILIFAKIAEIYLKIVILSFMIIIREGIYSIIAILSFITVIGYVFIETYHYEFKKPLNFKENLKAYINKNKEFSIIVSVLSITFAILITHFRSYIDHFFLFILLIAAILSYFLLFNQKNIKEILYKLSKDDIDMIILLSSVLSLSFSKVRESIANIFALHSTAYSLFTYIIIVITIFFLMLIMSLYVYILNTNRSLENMIKWLILTAFSISLLIVYLSIPSIWYIFIAFLSFLILIFMYLHIHSCILKNINKEEDLNNILGIVLTLYILSSAILYPGIEVLYAAIIYVSLTIILPFIYCLKINKDK